MLVHHSPLGQGAAGRMRLSDATGQDQGDTFAVRGPHTTLEYRHRGYRQSTGLPSYVLLGTVLG